MTPILIRLPPLSSPLLSPLSPPHSLLDPSHLPPIPLLFLLHVILPTILLLLHLHCLHLLFLSFNLPFSAPPPLNQHSPLKTLPFTWSWFTITGINNQRNRPKTGSLSLFLVPASGQWNRSVIKITLTPVGAAPQVSDNLVDLVHLHAVELHDGTAHNMEHRSQTKCSYRQSAVVLNIWSADEQPISV